MHDQENPRTNVLRESGPKRDGVPLALAMGLLAEWTKDSAGPLDLARR